MEKDGLDIPNLARKKTIEQEIRETSHEDSLTSTPLDTPHTDINANKKSVVNKVKSQDNQKSTQAKKSEDNPKTKKKKKVAKTTTDDPLHPHKSTAERSADLKKKLNEIAEREKKKINASNRNFLIFLTKFFLILIAAGYLFMFLVWNGLQSYEKNTPNGAMMQYVSLLRQEKYDKIYEGSNDGFTQLNRKEDYIAYLQEIYGDADLKNAVFSKKAYSDSEFLYYDLIIDNTTLSTLELRYLSEDQRWVARTVVSSRNFYLDVLGDPTIYVNNVQLDNTYRTEESVNARNYENLYDTNVAPKISRYHIDNLVTVPEVTVGESEQYKVVKDAIKDQFYVGYPPSAAFEATATDLIRTTATTYARYISEDAKFDELRALLYRRTDFYKAISEFNNRYFSTHDSYHFDKVQVSDIVSLGEEEGFIGTVSFDYTVNIEAKDISQTYANTYQLTFLRVSGKWLCSDIAIASQQEQ